ncbi:hypothetical protein E4U43_002383 [Claviceps pusilla]|uniref:Spore coat protein SP96 n=1 Tax=Claviceps pusilla TaxID=123648 RepID=A0A9P7SXJ7_9HYPO|nr:hypothetical protein E4U43_002383 [Claviceps pusilla]
MRLLSILAWAVLTTAHIEMTYPAPFRSKYNRYSTDIDDKITDPLESDGLDFPCKGYHALMDKPQGRSVATWQLGQTYTVSLEGHNSYKIGSCQLSLSYNKGRNWTAIQSYIGGCPLKPHWQFTLPADASTGHALFAWTWFNRLGKQEMWMNCAHVTIQKSTLSPNRTSLPFHKRPKMFVANVGNNCTTLQNLDVQFPSPGPDVVSDSDKTAAPVGDCM